jgi:hypothetical protein
LIEIPFVIIFFPDFFIPPPTFRRNFEPVQRRLDSAEVYWVMILF